MNKLAWSERSLTLSSRKEWLLPGEQEKEEGLGQVSPQPSTAPTSALASTAEKSSCALH